MIQPGPGVVFAHGNRKPWASSFNPTTGLITFTNPGNPRQVFEITPQEALRQGANLPTELVNQWESAAQQYKAYQAQTAGGGAGTAGSGAFTAANAGPLLSQAYSDIQQQQAATGKLSDLMNQSEAFAKAAQAQAKQLYGRGYDELSKADQQIVQANALVKMTTTGEGLFPAQQAMIEQARASEETQLESTLGTAGLGQSSQLAQLRGAADLGAAATAGQLQQGNIQAAEQVLAGALGQQAGAQKTIDLSQTASKLALGGMTLEAGEQQQLVTELANITAQSLGMQQQMWKEAMEGYGLMGSIIDQSSKAYGYSLDAYKSTLSALEQHAQTQVGLQEAQMKADQQSTSDLFTGLGTLFGQQGVFGSGGAGSSLLGGIGGLFGGGAAAGGLFGGGAAAVGAGAGGVGIDAVVTAVGAAI
jgi:hypothetical protein